MAEGGIIAMKQGELKRLYIVRQVLDKKLKQKEAADKLNLSYRQVKRIAKRVREEGNKGIVHKSRGQPSHNRLPTNVKNKVLNLCQGKYKGFGPTLASEKLFEIEKLKVSDETLRHWLINEGLWQTRRKTKKYRKWRQRKHYPGEMIQWDGSHHDWLENRGSKCVLISQIDDATNRKSGQFYTYEGTITTLASLKQYIKEHGVPHSIYLDRHSTYKTNKKLTIEDQLNNRELLSQFERAAKELGIKVIHAHSPQAKGRIERSFKTDQDRLVKEMRLANIKTIKEANKFLKSYWPKHNKKFSIKPVKEVNIHRPMPKDMDLDAILCKRTKHILRNDFTIVRNKKLYQILNKCVGKEVTFEERTAGANYIVYKGKKLKYKQIAIRPRKEKSKPKPRIINRPGIEHPWKKTYGRNWLSHKAHLQTKKASEELVLVEA